MPPIPFDPARHVARTPAADALLQREAAINNRPFLRHLFGIAKYLGIGALVHAWLLGAEFDPASTWSWGYLLAWPVPVLLWLAGWILLLLGYAAVLGAGCGLLWAAASWAIGRRVKRASPQR